MDVPDRIRNALANHRFFQEAKRYPLEFEQLVRSLQYVQYSSDENVITQGSTGKDLYILEDGSCQVWLDKFGTDTQVGKVHPGEAFGELAFLYDRPRAATVKTVEKSKVWVLKHSAITTFIEAVPALVEDLKYKRILRSLVSKHVLFSHIDDERILEELIDRFTYRSVPRGIVLVQQGDSITDESPFFVLVQGTVKVLVENQQKNIAKRVVLGPGSTIGDFDLLLHRPRIQHAETETQATVLQLKNKDYRELTLKGTQCLQVLFDQYCSIDDMGEKYLTLQDFKKILSPCTTEGHTVISGDKLNLLFQLADKTDSRWLSFQEFSIIASLLEANASEYRIAFHFMDQDHDGLITEEEMRIAMRNLVHLKGAPSTVQLNRLCVDDLFQSGAISFDEFEQYMRHVNGSNPSLSAYVSFWRHLGQQSTECLHSVMTQDEDIVTFGETETEDRGEAYKYLLAGAVAGVMSRTFVSPLIRLKMLMQTQSSPRRIKSIADGFRYMHKTDGLIGFFKGNGTNVLRVAPTTALQFFLFEQLKQKYFKVKLGEQNELQPLERLLLGGCAGSASAVVMYPLDLIRARLTVQTSQAVQYTGVAQAISSMIRESGVRSLYRGLWPTLVGVFPYIGIDFAVYGTLKSQLSPDVQTGQYHALQLLTCGGIAGIVSQTVAFPLELIRRRLQVQGFVHNDYNYTGGIWDALHKTYRKDGIPGLYRGISVNYIKAVPSIGVGFLVYERMKEKLEIS